MYKNVQDMHNIMQKYTKHLNNKILDIHHLENETNLYFHFFFYCIHKNMNLHKHPQFRFLVFLIRFL